MSSREDKEEQLVDKVLAQRKKKGGKAPPAAKPAVAKPASASAKKKDAQPVVRERVEVDETPV